MKLWVVRIKTVPWSGIFGDFVELKELAVPDGIDALIGGDEHAKPRGCLAQELWKSCRRQIGSGAAKDRFTQWPCPLAADRDRFRHRQATSITTWVVR